MFIITEVESQNSEQESPYIEMNSRMKSVSILDTPTEADLPPPIVPTSEALHELMVSSETKELAAYSYIYSAESNEPLESSCTNYNSKSVVPPSVPPRRSSYCKSASTFAPITPTLEPVSFNSKPTIPMLHFSTSALCSHENNITLPEEFHDVSPATCRKIVDKNDGDIIRATKQLKVHQLMGMKLPFIEENDCVRALDHCQDKTDRAAVWLMDLSETISARRR